MNIAFESNVLRNANALKTNVVMPDSTPHPLSKERIEEIKKREQAATPKPWWSGHLHNGEHPCNCPYILDEGYMGGIAEVYVDNGKCVGEGGNDAPPLAEAQANQLFIAHARQDIPDLLAELDHRQEQTRQVLQGLLNTEAHPNDDFGMIKAWFDDAIRAAAQQLGLTLD
ncbi:hypothetical protein MUN82_08830 [Hymenobacter aerilatus]|uniref:Uncharacterized protein n=1 Tax=Hymenobacter aerilatus TaxID=2932251 RepID=A0A8T9SZZ1_9BACT|nr:hypothetical protein [Hymenobacter aerilatus]UOR07187.1 hypothetical protein MUN82_08830 [Hymenobacter aerilatus]